MNQLRPGEYTLDYELVNPRGEISFLEFWQVISTVNMKTMHCSIRNPNILDKLVLVTYPAYEPDCNNSEFYAKYCKYSLIKFKPCPVDFSII